MIISGEEAVLYNAVRLDDFTNANKGELISADDMTGVVTYKDITGESKSITLGPHAIKILLKKR